MRASKTGPLTAIVVLACASACDYTQDYVAPSCYGDTPQAGQRAVAANSGNLPTEANPSKPASSKPMTGAAAGATAAPGMALPPADSGGSDKPAEPMPRSSAGSNTSATSTCDLTGQWLLTLHKVTDGLGNLQYVHDYFFYELEQQGDSVTVKKSLKCGADVIGGGAFAITVDYTGAQAGVMKHVSHNGRSGTSVSGTDGCEIEFAEHYAVEGATIPHYLDPSNPLPSVDQMATGGTPGWEDWDEDGNPGITGVCEGTVNGKIFTAAREWTTYAGTVPDTSSLIKLSLEWDQEPNVMAFEGSPFLGSTAVRAADASLHFVELARLSSEQTSGDDRAVCQRLVELAPTLTAAAAGM